MLESLYPWRDEVLDRARLEPGETLLDVGAGDGLVAFGALDRVGPSGRVIFSDVSQDLLDHCRDAAAAEGLLSQCDFVRAPAESLEPVADASVDVVTTRSVLIYVRDKAAALREFYRVLRPGGRVSLFEPINRLMHDPARPFGYDTSPVTDLAQRVRAVYESIQPPDSDPMADFDDRDLVRHTERAGFPEIALDLRLSVTSARTPTSWETFIAASANPLVPPLREVMDQVLSAAERAEFTAVLKPQVESGAGQRRSAIAFLTATKGA